MGVWGKYRAGDLSFSSASLWSVFWVLAGIVVAVPNSTAMFAKAVGIGRGADLVVYLSLAGIFFLIFRLTVHIDRLNKQLTRLVRQQALNDVKLPVSSRE